MIFLFHPFLSLVLTIYLIITNEMNSSLRSVVVLLGAPLSDEAAKTRANKRSRPNLLAISLPPPAYIT